MELADACLLKSRLELGYPHKKVIDVSGEQTQALIHAVPCISVTVGRGRSFRCTQPWARSQLCAKSIKGCVRAVLIREAHGVTLLGVVTT
jgi:hypothetical protein